MDKRGFSDPLMETDLAQLASSHQRRPEMVEHTNGTPLRGTDGKAKRKLSTLPRFLLKSVFQLVVIVDRALAFFRWITGPD
jgi:hypothetical protein